MSGDFTKEQEIADIRMRRPHVVILGAGASLAACPDGDITAKKLPLMNNFVEVLDLSDLLANAEIHYLGVNFEELYSLLCTEARFHALRKELEGRIYDYFRDLKLPDHPTIYDHLVLSLRSKDVIATFNWDPFLTQAYRRTERTSKKPRLNFLHGNVTIAYCENDGVLGVIGNICSRCRKPLTPSRLLYPVTKKNYEADGFISGQWAELQTAMSNAFMITLFGYGAPASDLSAIELMKDAWGDKYERNLEQTELIDIRDEKELLATWNPFVHTHHYDIHPSFYDSWIAKHPRRTGEAWINQYIDALFIEDNPVPASLDFSQMQKWYDPLFDAEEELPRK